MQAKDVRVDVDYSANAYASRGRQRFLPDPDEVITLTALEVTDTRRKGAKVVRCRVAALPEAGTARDRWRRVVHGEHARRPTWIGEEPVDERPQLQVGDEVSVPCIWLLSPAATYTRMYDEHQRAEKTASLVRVRERARTQVLADALQARLDAARINARAYPAEINENGQHTVYTAILSDLTIEQTEALLTALNA